MPHSLARGCAASAPAGADSLPVKRRRSASAIARRFPASIASSRCCDACASADDTSLGGISPAASFAFTSATWAFVTSTRAAEHDFGIAGGDDRPVRAGDLETEIGARRVHVPGDRAAFGAGGAFERVAAAAGVNRPLQIEPGAVVVGNVRVDDLRRAQGRRDREHVDVVRPRVAAEQRDERALGRRRPAMAKSAACARASSSASRRLLARPCAMASSSVSGPGATCPRAAMRTAEDDDRKQQSQAWMS